MMYYKYIMYVVELDEDLGNSYLAHLFYERFWFPFDLLSRVLAIVVLHVATNSANLI